MKKLYLAFFCFSIITTSYCKKDKVDKDLETQLIIRTGKTKNTNLYFTFKEFNSVDSQPFSAINLNNTNKLFHPSHNGDITFTSRFPTTSNTVYIREYSMLGNEIVGEFIDNFQVNEKNNLIGLNTTYSDIQHVKFSVARLDYYKGSELANYNVKLIVYSDYLE